MIRIISRIARTARKGYEYIMPGSTRHVDKTRQNVEQTVIESPPRGFVKMTTDPLQNILLNISRLPEGKNILGRAHLQKANVCLMSHLIFYYLGESNNAMNISEVIRCMLNSSDVLQKLHQFPWNCQGLPQVIKAISRCCTLYKEKDELENCSDEILQNICLNSVELLHNMLFPLFKRTRCLQERLTEVKSDTEREEELLRIQKENREQREAYNRILEVTGEVLKKFTDILKDFGKMWPGKLGGLLIIFCSDVVKIVIEIELEQASIKEGLEKFTKQVPDTIEVFGRCKAEEWKLTLQSLCTENWPDNSHLCEMWKLLVKISTMESYEFLGVLFKKTICGMLREEPLKGQILRVEADVAEIVTGAINHLFIQCTEVGPEDKYLKGLFIKPELLKLIDQHGEALEQECPKMFDYLSNKMVKVMESADCNRMESTTEKVKILFFAANPKDTQQLAIGEEVREIEKKIREAQYRDSFIMIQKWATRYGDVQLALLENKPHIVHFSSHGTTANKIVLMDKQGDAKPISREALKELFEILKDNIRGVILNACYSTIQAKAITEVVDFAIGMKKEIGDEAAIEFAASFYRAIGFNESVKTAFRLGCNTLKGMGIPDADIPELLVHEGVDPSKIYLLNAQ